MKEFQERIEKPVEGKTKGAFEFLRSVVAATCLRRIKEDHALGLNLPRKEERIERIDMDHDTRDLYEFFKRFSYEAFTASRARTKSSGNILVLISILRLICDHGEALLSPAAVAAWKQRDTKLLTWRMFKDNTPRCISCDCESEELGGGGSLQGWSCDHILCERCEIKSQDLNSQPSCPKCDVPEPISTLKRDGSRVSPSNSWPGSSTKTHQWPPSPKVEALLRNIGATHDTEGSKAQQAKRFVIYQIHQRQFPY